MNTIYLVGCCFLMFSCENKVLDSSYPIVVDRSHFTYKLYDGLSQDIVLSIEEKLDQNYSRVLSDLKIDSMKKVTVKILGSRNNFYQNMKEVTGTIYYGATGWIPNIQDIRILYSGDYTPQIVLHEFCHAASLAVNSTIGNNPRWLWEAIAVYEAGEFRNPKSLDYIVIGNFPTIQELNSSYNSGPNKIYAVGYVLSEYIIITWGKAKYIALIRSNGDIQSTLDITLSKFEEGFKSFVTIKYLNK